MNIVNNHRVCNGCIFSSFHYCNKFNKVCLSARFNSERYQLICNECFQDDQYTFGLTPFNSNPEIKKAYFRLPGLQNFKEIKSLLLLKKFYPEIFYNNREIIGIYDSFPGALWNGRQPNFSDKIYSYEELIELRTEIENLNLTLNLTWNNHLLEDTDIYDKYCNIITEIFHNGKHSITVASEILYNYLITKYPNYTYYLSTIATDNKNLQQYNFNLGYDKYVLNRRLNNNWDELNKIPMEDRIKIELICNDFCPPFCNRMHHYNLGNELLLQRKNPINPVLDYCSLDYDFINFNNSNWPITIKSSDIDNYINNGFQYFKLCSRSDATPILLLKILPYFVKNEYLLDAFSWSYNKYELTDKAVKQHKGEKLYEH